MPSISLGLTTWSVENAVAGSVPAPRTCSIDETIEGSNCECKVALLLQYVLNLRLDGHSDDVKLLAYVKAL